MSEVAYPCHSTWEAERLQVPGQPGFAVQATQWLPSLCSSIETQDKMARNLHLTHLTVAERLNDSLPVNTGGRGASGFFLTSWLLAA